MDLWQDLNVLLYIFYYIYILGLLYGLISFWCGHNDEQTNDDNDDTLEVIVGEGEMVEQTEGDLKHGWNPLYDFSLNQKSTEEDRDIMERNAKRMDIL